MQKLLASSHRPIEVLQDTGEVAGEGLQDLSPWSQIPKLDTSLSRVILGYLGVT